jgi:transketolase
METNTDRLREISKNLRKTLVTAIYESGSGHIGGSLSWADIGTSLFFSHMNLNGKYSDRFILSKGHSVPTLYAILAIRGELDTSLLKTIRKIDSSLEGHPRVGMHPRICASSGALGQGLSVGIGYAVADKVLGRNQRTYVLLGDGECQEGQIWEAAMSAYKLKQEGKMAGLTAIIDYNRVQGDAHLHSTMPGMNQIDKMWESFGWHVQNINGHDMKELLESYKIADSQKYRPAVIIARTKKGKGVSFMEKEPVKWHGGSLNEQLYKLAIAELNG